MILGEWNKYIKVIKCLFFKRFYLFILGRGKGKEKERERNISVCLPLVCPLQGTWPATQACALTRNWTGDPLVCSLCSIHWATPGRAEILVSCCYLQKVSWRGTHFSAFLTVPPPPSLQAMNTSTPAHGISAICSLVCVGCGVCIW